MPRPKKSDNSARVAKFIAARDERIEETKMLLLTVLHNSIGHGFTVDDVRIHPEKETTNKTSYPYVWRLQNGFAWPKRALLHWNKTQHDEVRQAVLAGNIVAEYTVPEIRSTKEVPLKDGEDFWVDEEDATASDCGPDDLDREASSSPEIDWGKYGVERIKKRVDRQLRKEAGEEDLSEWESEISSVDEEEVKQLEEGLTPKSSKGRKKGKGKGKGKNKA